MAKNKSDRPRDMANDIIGLVQEGTKKWTKTKKAEERSPASRFYRYSRMTRERGVSAKEAAAQIMEKAYLKASGNGQYPANARQIMYAARPHIQKVTGKQLEPNYFTQTLPPDYLQESGADWDVVYDARGHFKEPHGGQSFGVGTLEVRGYLADLHEPRILDADFSQAKVETSGPNGNFGAVLFVEKEGFDPLLKKARIVDKFDIAIMSTKGMSVTAARELADKMCHDHDIPLLLLRDFDKAGFSIAGCMVRRVYGDVVFNRERCQQIAHEVHRAVVVFFERVELHVWIEDDEVWAAPFDSGSEEALDDIDDDDFNAPRDLQRRVRKYLKEHPQERWDKAISAIVAERNR